MSTFRVFAQGEDPRGYRSEEEAIKHAKDIAERHTEPVAVYSYTSQPMTMGADGTPSIEIDVTCIAVFDRTGPLDVAEYLAAKAAHSSQTKEKAAEKLVSEFSALTAIIEEEIDPENVRVYAGLESLRRAICVHLETTG